MEPPNIEQLDEQTVQRIAAGEVVERPASVVKELVENSLDAGASRVAVAVEAGGTEGIRVRDDGVGIPADQLEAAVAEHATSKIADIDDLEAGVGTLGFRGEALYTVGAVSRLTVRSRPPNADAGAEVTVEGGDVGTVQPVGCPVGTTVEVEDLFFNTPARKKFLKRVTTEFDHVNTVVSSYALANPDVAVSLEHDGRETFATEGNDDRRSAVLAVYGRPVAESMIDVAWTPGDDTSTGGGDDTSTGDGDAPNKTEGPVDADHPVRRVTGLISHPETTRASRDYLTTYVNGRYVTAGALRESVLDAYGGQLASDRYPFAVLFVEVPPADVDVNVHPRKLEVRFDREAAVRSAVESAVESALLNHGLIRSTAPRGRSAPDEVDVAPERPTNEVLGGAAGASGRDGEEAAETAESTTPERVSSDSADMLDPDDDEAWSVDGLSGAETRASKAETASKDPDASSDTDASGDTDTSSDPDASGDIDTSGDTDASGDIDASGSPAPADATKPETLGDTDRSTTGSASTDAASQGGSTARTDAGETTDRRVDRRTQTTRRTEPTQHTLDGDETGTEHEYDSLPPLRVLGQLHDTYVVAEAPDGLVLIDQHAADERVHYERLQATVADGPAAQALAEPVTVEVTAREAALFGAFLSDLAAIGFRAERTDERQVTVKAVPAVFDATLDPTLLRDVLAEFAADAAADRDADAGAPAVADAVDELLADLACYPSITGNTSLTDGRVVDLLDQLDDCSNPYACPHGRPVVIRLDHDELGARFERDYPGHTGRRSE